MAYIFYRTKIEKLGSLNFLTGTEVTKFAIKKNFILKYLGTYPIKAFSK